MFLFFLFVVGAVFFVLYQVHFWGAKGRNMARFRNEALNDDDVDIIDDFGHRVLLFMWWLIRCMVWVIFAGLLFIVGIILVSDMP